MRRIIAVLIAIAAATAGSTAQSDSKLGGPTVIQVAYYAQPGKANDVFAQRQRASDVLEKLGLPRGRILRRSSGSAKDPDVMWECEYPNAVALDGALKAATSNAEFEDVRKQMEPLIRKGEKRVWEAQPTLPRSADVRAIVDRHNADATHWYAAGDVDSLASIFAADAWQMPPNHDPLVGREAIRAFWRQAVTWGKWDFKLEAQSVDVSGSMAVERGKYSLRFRPGTGAPAGMHSSEDHGNYLVYWRLDSDGQWRIVADAPVSAVTMGPPPRRS